MGPKSTVSMKKVIEWKMSSFKWISRFHLIIIHFYSVLLQLTYFLDLFLGLNGADSLRRVTEDHQKGACQPKQHSRELLDIKETKERSK